MNMKNGECIECGKPLYDQNPDEPLQICDDCRYERDIMENEDRPTLISHPLT